MRELLDTAAGRADERLLTARAVAEMLDVSTETVLRWTRTGKLPAIRLPGGAIRYRPAQLEEWLAAMATSAPAAATEPSVLPLTGDAGKA